MKKFFYFITIFALAVGLVSFCFNLGEYDFFAQLSNASAIPFVNPVECFKNIINKLVTLDFDPTKMEWWQYILFNPFVTAFITWLANVIWAIIQFLLCLVNDLVCGLRLVLVLLGFDF